MKNVDCNVCPSELSILDLGCFSHCGKIVLGIKANSSGLHTYIFKYGNRNHVFKNYARKNEFLKVDNNFNENSSFELKILNPDGTNYNTTIWNKTLSIKENYNVFKLCIEPTSLIIPGECNWCCLPVEECENEILN